ncbi:ATP-binding protein, partial [Streptomyces sp. PB17]|uniref:ATP-binding protein n=1 Tax=Streptomyces sp. PB17 TaxID=3384158 RepID=UPI0038B4DD25
SSRPHRINNRPFSSVRSWGRSCVRRHEEKNSVAIASNESFSGWTKTFTDPRLCAAIVDRLTFGGNIIETGTDSYRLATTRAQAERAGV